MTDLSVDMREQLLLSLSGLIQQCTELADTLGLADAAEGLRIVWMQVSGSDGGPLPPEV